MEPRGGAARADVCRRIQNSLPLGAQVYDDRTSITFIIETLINASEASWLGSGRYQVNCVRSIRHGFELLKFYHSGSRMFRSTAFLLLLQFADENKHLNNAYSALFIAGQRD